MSVLKGGERTLHRWSIVTRQAGVWILAGVIGGGGAWGIGMKMTSSQQQWHAAQSVFLSMGEKKQRALHSREWQGFKANSRRSAQLGFAGVAGALFLLWWLFDKFGQVGDKKHKRGSRLVSSAQLGKIIRRRSKVEPDLHLCGVPLPPGSEQKHLLMIGTTGVGKSTAMRELLDQVRSKNERAIVYDPNGHFLSEYAKEGDALLSPFDARSDAWSIFNEVQSKRDARRIAKSLVTKKEGTDEGFVNGARAILGSMIWKLHQDGNPSMQKFYDWLEIAEVDEITELLKGTPGGRHLGKDASEQASGMLSFATESAESIEAYADVTYNDDDPPFSLRKWVREGPADSIVWLPAQKGHIEEVLPLISLWFDIASSELMGMGEAAGRRLWFFADEVASLSKMEALPTLLAEGRKFGAVGVLGFQSMSQLRLKYGRDGAAALLDLLRTKLVFAVGDPEVAEYASKVIGEAEIERKNEGESLGRGGRDGSSLNQQITREPLVMPSQIQNLPDYQAYVILPGDYPHAVVRTTERHDIAKIPAFVEVV